MGQSYAPPPPPPPPPPNYNINLNTGGGPGTTVQSGLDPAGALSAVSHAVAASGGIIGPVGPGGGAFILEHKKWYLTLTKVKMDGRFTVTQSGSGSSVAVALSTGANALIPTIAITLVCGLLLTPLFPVAVISSIYTWWYYNSKIPREIEGEILGRLQTAPSQAPSAAMPPPFANPAQPVYPQNQPSDGPPVGPPPAATGDPYEQLRKLAGLRDAGALTPEEFEAKKADILTRL